MSLPFFVVSLRLLCLTCDVAQTQPVAFDQGRLLGDIPPLEVTGQKAISNSSEVTLPLGVLQIEDQAAAIPDWRVITFNDFPKFATDGEWADARWEAGDAISDILTLGDFQVDLQLHLLTIQAIGEKLGLERHELSALSLGEVQFLERQTLTTLVRAVPALLNQRVDKVPPIRDLALAVRPMLRTSAISVERLLHGYPELGDIRLNHVELSHYRMEHLDGLAMTPLQAFEGWQEISLNEVPMLNQMSWWLFPQRINLDGEIAMASISQDASGDVLHLTPANDALLSAGIDIGKMQPGGIGEGPLAQVNEGHELSGVTPFGSAFKVVPQWVTPNGIQTVLYFRRCRSEGLNTVVTCSPYGIGPLPFIRYEPGAPIFVGQGFFRPRETEADPAQAGRPNLDPVPAEAVANQQSGNRFGFGTAGVGMMLAVLIALGAWVSKGKAATLLPSPLRGLARAKTHPRASK